MSKTYYPTFRRDVHKLALFLARRGPAMTQALGLSTGNDSNGVPYATGLANLQNAVNEIESFWPRYSEPQ